MAANSTLLCIHREPAQLRLLEERGYELVTATNGGDGLRLFMSRPVDAIVLDYHLGLLDGAVVASEIRQVKPQVPIVMLADHLELPDGALKSVDAVVAKSDGPDFLLETIQSVLSAKSTQIRGGIAGTQRRTSNVRTSLKLAMDQSVLKEAPFSAKVRKSTWNGSVRF
jgi:two-component system alkaline phosphatase synthesis response regulator PhoP